MMRDPDSDVGHVFARAATIDELLSDAYEPVRGQRGDAESAARRLAAWCRAATGGDWTLFSRRLARDGWSLDEVLCRFATVRRAAPPDRWMRDATWIAVALRDPPGTAPAPVAFGELLAPAVQAADRHLRSGLDAGACHLFSDDAFADLDGELLTELSELTAPALFEAFAEERDAGRGYLEFVSDMRAGGFGRLFEDKPVLLRLVASVTRQWLESSRELMVRLQADRPAIEQQVLRSGSIGRVVRVRGRLSDPHHFGRTVAILEFENGARVVYKPKDLRVDAAWHALVDRLNIDAPIVLRAARPVVRDGYGWTEHIAHDDCVDRRDFAAFFRRAGAWLALFHVFVTVDMHQENILATASHPVPVDLETILQVADTRFGGDGNDAGAAFRAAMRTVVDSVMTVGLLPAYGKEAGGRAFLIGGVTSNASPRVRPGWTGLGTDQMCPVQVRDVSVVTTNVPHVGSDRGRLADHLDDFIAGFTEYCHFIRRRAPADLLSGFAGLPIRTVVRPTRYYAMLVNRLRDHRTMSDGVIWSAQADITARLADWDGDTDPAWPVQRSEREALLDLNVPHFVSDTDGRSIRIGGGLTVATAGSSGLARASARLRGLGSDEIDWQVELIRQNTALLQRDHPPRAHELRPGGNGVPPSRAEFLRAADDVAALLCDHAIERGPGAAWIGLDWLDDSEMSQLVVLGPDLYNGNGGIAVFLAAHAAVTGDSTSRRVAVAAMALLRETLRGRNPARIARTLGIGGALGLSSVVYALAVVAALIADDEMLDDACAAARLITDDVVAADRQWDVLGGSAGAILALLRLHRQTSAPEYLRIAERCGRHLLAQQRVGDTGRRMWPSPHFGHPLTGMAHGATGFAYGMAALAAATGERCFAIAADECIAYENSTVDAGAQDWRDPRRDGDGEAPCKWCYGAPGIALGRLAMSKLADRDVETYRHDVDRALAVVDRRWPPPTDTLCCGTPATVEFLSEAAAVTGREELQDRAAPLLGAVLQNARATGAHRWTSGSDRFNLGLFRGIAGVGYTALRRIDGSLPNVLIWE